VVLIVNIAVIGGYKKEEKRTLSTIISTIISTARQHEKKYVD